ncbi:hypothetical protein [Kutzneria sp. NPDC052558]|uniref:hypothetical protein n=1 Tax=Kutzneria sp. NPDC052558 TaxID=3364121 RepID=UPI0037C5E984
MRAPRETRTPQELWEAAGNTLDPTGDYSTRTALITCSYTLIEEVLAVMAQAGATARMGPVRRVSEHGEVLGVEFQLGGQTMLMPMVPLRTTLQVYRFEDVQLAEPVAEVHAPLPEPAPAVKAATGKAAAQPAPWPSMTALAWELLALLGITPPEGDTTAGV